MNLRLGRIYKLKFKKPENAFVGEEERYIMFDKVGSIANGGWINYHYINRESNCIGNLRTFFDTFIVEEIKDFI